MKDSATQTADRFANLEIEGSSVPTPAAVATIAVETPDHLRRVSPASINKFPVLPAIIGQIQQAATLKSDKLIPARNMRFDDGFRLDGMELTPRGIQRAAKLTGVPKPMIDYMLAHDDAKSVIPHLNREFSEIAERAAGDKNYLVRMIRDEPEGDPRVRAIFSDSYVAIDHTDALDMFCKGMPDGDCRGVRAHSMHLNEERLSVNLILPDRMIQRSDSDYGVGVALRNSEVGKSSYQILPFLYRGLCANGMVFGRVAQEIRVKQIHAGKIDMAELQAAVSDAIAAALGLGDKMLAALQAVKEVEVNDPQRMIALLSDRFDLNRSQSQAWNTAFAVEPEQNGFGILNGLTRAAQGFEGTVRNDMESAAGDMLTVSLEADLRQIIGRWERFEADAQDVKAEQVVKLFAVR